MPKLRVLVILLVITVIAGAAFVASGVYNVAATDQHTSVVYWLLKSTMRQSVRRHASDIRVPDLEDATQVARGRGLYQAHCIRCHGAPGVAPDSFALGLRPVPSNIAHTARELRAADVYWTIRSGLKMTGMPAWEYRLSDRDIWAIVAYVKKMPDESPKQYATEVRQLETHRFAAAANAAETRNVGQSDAQRGRKAIQQYACVTCHDIPGETGPSAPVGPPLDKIGRRGFIAGLLANTPDNMARWLQAPQEVHPGSAMPNLGVTPRDAYDIAAYLHTLH